MLSRSALRDQQFLHALNEEELTLVAGNKELHKFMLICFGLFVMSGLLIVFL